MDCRLPPEQTPADVEPLIRAAIGDGDYEIEWLEAVGGTRSPIETPLWDAVDRTSELEPGAAVGPIASPGSRTATFSARRTGRSRTASSR